MISLEPGDRVTVSAHKADGTRYRRWQATVEAVADDHVVVVTQPGHRVEYLQGTFTSEHAIRGFYWLDRSYSLLEAYARDGSLVEVYVNIASPAKVCGSDIRFTDHELDVSRRLPGEARIVDQDEFAEAAARYGYSEEFQRACYRTALEARELANRWVAGGMPAPEN
jgi:protein associated with RNAse G/E